MRGVFRSSRKRAVGAEDISLQEGGQEVDQPGAADALGLHLVDGHEHGFGVVGIDAHFFHGAAGRPHAVTDAAPLEGRAGRAGGAGQPLLVADDDLAVGADVDVQGKLGVFKNSRSQHPGHDIPPHVAGHGTDAVDEDVLRQIQPQVPGPYGGDVAGRGGVGRQADIFRVDGVQQVRHGGIGGHGEVGNFVHRQVVLLQESVGHLVDGVHHRLLEGQEAPFFLTVHDAGDDVVAVTQLAVVVRGMTHDLAFSEVQQLHPHRGGADVHGQGEVPAGGVSRLDIHETGVAGPPLGEVQGGRYLEILLAQGPGELPGQEKIQGQVAQPVLTAYPLLQAGQVADVVG